MKPGKVPETILKRSVLAQIKHKRPEVLVGAGIGEDCAVVQIPPDEVLVVSTDPITAASIEAGKYAIHVTANDIAAGGAEVFGVMLTLLLPDGTSEEALRQMMAEMEAECEKLDIQIIGGHTEVTSVVNQPVITVTGLGRMSAGRIPKSADLIPGQDLVMTKWAGIEGTSILAKEKEAELKRHFPADFIDQAKRLSEYISVVDEAKIAMQHGALVMHDITEGGVFGALWEVAAASNVGVEVDLYAIPIKQETVEICEYFDINPYMLMSSGCLLIGCDDGEGLVTELAGAGIPAAVIGRVTSGNDRVILNRGERRFLTPPESDHLYRVL
ncbi:MAG: AIR synthase family protein [Lachnospiraceae bacterium]|nr:AIR synthase family protein [Lachnospiraceae bacterium]